MVSIRLSDDLEKRLERLARNRGVTKSDIIKEALSGFLAESESSGDPFKLGEDLFGRYQSEETDLSVTYKYRLKEQLREKHTR